MITLLSVHLLTALAALMMWLIGPEISEIHQITSRKVYRFFSSENFGSIDSRNIEILRMVSHMMIRGNMSITGCIPYDWAYSARKGDD